MKVTPLSLVFALLLQCGSSSTPVTPPRDPLDAAPSDGGGQAEPVREAERGEHTATFPDDFAVATVFFASDMFLNATVLPVVSSQHALEGCPKREGTLYRGDCATGDGIWEFFGTLNENAMKVDAENVSKDLLFEDFGFSVEKRLEMHARGRMKGIAGTRFKIDFASDQLSVSLKGDHFRFDDKAWPMQRAVTLTFTNMKSSKTPEGPYLHQKVEGLVTQRDGTTFSLRGEWVWHVGEGGCHGEPISGSLVGNGKDVVIFSFDGETSCDKRSPYRVGSREGALLLEGNIPLYW